MAEEAPRPNLSRKKTIIGLTKPKEEKQYTQPEDEYDLFPGTSEEGPQFRIRDVFTSHHSDSGYDHGVPVDVTHYIQDKSLRRRLILLSLSNSKLGIRLMLLRALFMIISCLLYVVETMYYDYYTERGDFLNRTAAGDLYNTSIVAIEAKSLVLLLEPKPYSLWALQVAASIVVFCNAVFVVYVSSGETFGAVFRTLSRPLIVSLLIPLLYLVTAAYPPVLKDMFVPSFLYCWLALQSFTTAILQAVQRSLSSRLSSFRLRVVTLISVFICFLFSWTCILHHFFRIDPKGPFTLFETYYFLLVTMSTVGYGDIAPRHWTGQILVTIFIFTAIIYLIPQLHTLYEAFSLQQRLHNTVGFKDVSKRHILICSQTLRPLVLRDFLTEFYSDPTHYDIHSVVMVEKELSTILQTYLRHPIWAKRITVLIGTPLRINDLLRARTRFALAVFIHTPRDTMDSVEADQHTIMCAWAIKDHAPKVKLHVQILFPDNRLHLEMADSVVCEGELKNALLAINTHCPGFSTLITLLLHTFKPEQRPLNSEEYQLYTKCAPCEIYDSRLGDSKYFHLFQGKNFLYTAVVAFRKYHVTLLGVQSAQSKQLLLNPGLDYVMHQDDICYYIGFTREEYSKVGGATSISHAIQGTCAKLAIYSMAVAGMNPDRLDERAADKAASHESLVPKEETDGQAEFYLPEGSNSSINTDNTVDQQMAAVETRRGLHLFKFLSEIDTAANPVVRVSLARNGPDGDDLSVNSGDIEPPPRIDPHNRPSRLSLPHIHPSHHGHLGRQISEPLASRRMSYYPGGLSRDLLHPYRHSPLPGIRERTLSESSDNALKRAHSETSVVDDRVLYSSKLELMNSTSRINQAGLPTHPRFHFPRPSLFGGNHGSHRSSVTSLVELREEQVELELADIAEEEELEELEDGLCDEASSEGRSPSPDQPAVGEEQPKSKYWRGQVPNTPYFGFDTMKCHLLHEQRCHDDIIISAIGSDTEGGLDMVYCASITDDLYHFLVPLRAAHLPSSQIKPLVVMVTSRPHNEFLDTIAWLPLVYIVIGELSDVNAWLRAGITLADTVVIMSDPVLADTIDQHEHFADSAHIMAVQKLNKLFPHVSIVTELHYRYNIRFMRFTDCDHHFMGNFNALMRKGDHLTYLFVPQFAGGRVFCPSMLDTLLYQAHIKPYMIGLVRQLLGCKQEEDSGYLWHIPLTPELLSLETYERVFQRLVSQHRYIPLGIHRTIPGGHCVDLQCEMNTSKGFMDGARVSSFLDARMASLGLSELKKPEMDPTNYQSFVLPNPPPKTKLKENDIILVLHSAHQSHPHGQGQTNHSPQPSRCYTQYTPSHHSSLLTSPTKSACTRSSQSTRSRSVLSNQSMRSRSTRSRSRNMSGDLDFVAINVPVERHNDSVFGVPESSV